MILAFKKDQHLARNMVQSFILRKVSGYCPYIIVTNYIGKNPQSRRSLYDPHSIGVFEGGVPRLYDSTPFEREIVEKVLWADSHPEQCGRARATRGTNGAELRQKGRPAR